MRQLAVTMYEQDQGDGLARCDRGLRTWGKASGTISTGKTRADLFGQTSVLMHAAFGLALPARLVESLRYKQAYLHLVSSFHGSRDHITLTGVFKHCP